MVRPSSKLVLSALCALGLSCNQVWGVEPAHLAEDAGPPPPDGGPDPCAASPAVAKLCVKFEAEKAHPGYDVSTGASGLRIDGAGQILLFLYDKDPAKPETTYKDLLYYPAEASGTEVKIDDLPVTMSTTLTPGTWWLIARWEDNKSSTRTGDTIVQGGDFITVPSVGAGGRFVYAQITATTGTTATTTLKLLPVRRVEVDLSNDPSMKTKYSTFAVNGDGPVSFGVYDGDYDTAVFLEWVTTHCVNVGPPSATPPTVKTAFTTTVTGTHKLSADLEDYDTTGPWPRDGTLRTSIDPASNPTVTVTPSSWTATASAKFVTVIAPITPGAKTDVTKCP